MNMLGIPPNLRTNIDYVFILRENIVQNRKRLYECYAGMFPNLKYLSNYGSMYRKYECLVITTMLSNRIDSRFWYKASSHPPFRLENRKFGIIEKTIMVSPAEVKVIDNGMSLSKQNQIKQQ